MIRSVAEGIRRILFQRPLFLENLEEKFLKFVFPFTLYVLITDIILNIDLVMLKALSPHALSNLYGGYYTAASTLARIPYFLTYGLSGGLISVIATLFPLNGFYLSPFT